MPSTKFLTSPFILARRHHRSHKRENGINEMPKTNESKLETTIGRNREETDKSPLQNVQMSKSQKKMKQNWLTVIIYIHDDGNAEEQREPLD